MLMALMLGVNRLLAMAKDTSDLHFITIGEVFFQLISCSIALQFFGGGVLRTFIPPSIWSIDL
jgi:hypothetical protein